MQLNQNSQIRMVPTLHDLDGPVLSAFNSPFDYLTGLARPLLGVFKAVRFQGAFTSTTAANRLATKESRRLAYEIKQTLGIKGFVLDMSGSPSLATGLPACWDAVRPCLETLELEDAAAQILSEASMLAEALSGTDYKSTFRLTQIEALPLQAGLDFYHFVLPKMLVLTSALGLACEQELLRRGVTARALQKQAVGEDGLHDLFQSIRGILSLSLRGDEMPGVWSKYLMEASAQLKPIVQGENYNRASDALHKIARQMAPSFQDQISSEELESLAAIEQQVSKLEALLPSLIMSITLLKLYFRPVDRLTVALPSGREPKLAPEIVSGELATKGILCPGVRMNIASMLTP
jgi:hypothetical protein